MSSEPKFAIGDQVRLGIYAPRSEADPVGEVVHSEANQEGRIYVVRWEDGRQAFYHENLLFPIERKLDEPNPNADAYFQYIEEARQAAIAGDREGFEQALVGAIRAAVGEEDDHPIGRNVDGPDGPIEGLVVQLPVKSKDAGDWGYRAGSLSYYYKTCLVNGRGEVWSWESESKAFTRDHELTEKQQDEVRARARELVSRFSNEKAGSDEIATGEDDE